MIVSWDGGRMWILRGVFFAALLACSNGPAQPDGGIDAGNEAGLAPNPSFSNSKLWPRDVADIVR
jgi:hypothetical protein